MGRRFSCSFAIAVCLAMVAYRSPAPLIYTPGEGWVYESADGLGKWRREKAKDQLDVAQAAFDKKDYSLALRAAGRVIKVWPLADYAPNAQFLVARCHEMKNDDVLAFEEYQKVIEQFPKSDKVKDSLQKQYEIGLRFLAGQRFKLWHTIPFLSSMEKTATLFERITTNGPYGDVAPNAQLRIGAAQEKRKEFGLAVAAYDLALDRYHDRPIIAADATFRKGWCHYKEAQAAEYDQSAAGSAIETYTDFVSLYPDDRRVPQAQKIMSGLKADRARGSFQIAQYYEKRGKWDGALIYYNETVLNDPASKYAEDARARIEKIKQRQQSSGK